MVYKESEINSYSQSRGSSNGIHSREERSYVQSSLNHKTQEGQVFYADYAKPEGFCDEAWKAIYQYVFALANGANMDNSWYFGDWINEEHKNVAICSCNDGLRPVIIKIERTDEVSE